MQATLNETLERLGADVLQFATRRAAPHAVGVTIQVSLQHGALWVAGRYNKYLRNVSQSTWLVKGARYKYRLLFCCRCCVSPLRLSARALRLLALAPRPSNS